MSEKLKVDTRITVETPEGVDFQFRISGPGKRGMAMFIDLIFKFIVSLVFAFIAAALMVAVSPGLAQGVQLVAGFLIFWMYSALFETFWNGQTPGKRLMELRVLRGNGTPISFYEAFGRGLVWFADFIPLTFTVGLISMVATKRLQRLGDLVFDTIVVDESTDYSTPPLKLHSVEPIPRADCTGRFHVPERTLTVIERLFDQRRAISDARREEIAGILASQLRDRLGYSPPPVATAIGPAVSFSPYSRATEMPSYDDGVFLQRILRTFSEAYSEKNQPPVKHQPDITWVQPQPQPVMQAPPIVVNRRPNE